MKPGIYATVTPASYHADCAEQPSLSASIAHILLTQSPMHAWFSHPRLNPLYRPDHAARYDIGTAAHAMLLEKDQSNIVRLEFDDYRTKAAKQARDEARAAGKTPILAKHHAACDAMVRAAHTALDASELAGVFDTGAPEQTCIWQEGDVWCRSRFDWMTGDGSIIVDYKTAENAAPDGFIRRMPGLGYLTQAAFYLRGARALGFNPRFVFMVQEIEPPYACSFVGLSPAMQEIADANVDHAIEAWRDCMRTKVWPGYPTRICYAEPTSWQLTEYEMREAA